MHFAPHLPVRVPNLERPVGALPKRPDVRVVSVSWHQVRRERGRVGRLVVRDLERGLEDE